MSPGDLVYRAREIQAEAAEQGRTLSDAEAVAEASKEARLRAAVDELEKTIAAERARRDAAKAEAARLRPTKASAGPAAKASQSQRMEVVRIVCPAKIV